MFLQIPIIPGIDQYLAPAIQRIGETISLFTGTDRREQEAIRDMLIENPEMIQDFADAEFKSPGFMKQLGFDDKTIEMVSGVGPSMDTRREELFGDRALALEEQRLGVQEFKYNLIQNEIARNPNISALELGALINEELGIPRSAELEKEDLELIPLQLQAYRASAIMEAAQRGENVEGAVYDFVQLFRAGKDDPQVTSSIMAHPLLGPQFESMFELLNFRENAELQKDLANLRMSASGLPSAVQREINMANDLTSSMAEIRRLLAEHPSSVGLKFVGPEILNARLDPEGVRLRATIAGLSSTLFHLRSGTAVTANEKTRLEPLTPNRWDTAETIYRKLDELDRFFREYISNRVGMFSSGGSINISGSPQMIQQLIDLWIVNGMSDNEIKDNLRKIGVDPNTLVIPSGGTE